MDENSTPNVAVVTFSTLSVLPVGFYLVEVYETLQTVSIRIATGTLFLTLLSEISAERNFLGFMFFSLNGNTVELM